MAYALQRVEKPLLRGRIVYVRNQVYSVYEALLNVLEQAQAADDSEEDQQEDWWSITDDSDDTFKSSTTTTTTTGARGENQRGTSRRRRRGRDTSRPPSGEECVISIEEEEDAIEPLRSLAWGRNDHLRTLFDILNLRDAIICHSILQGIIYGTVIIVLSVLPQNFDWEALGQRFFGAFNLVYGVVGIGAATSRRLWLIHCAETASTSISVALLVEMLSTSIKFVATGLAGEWLWPNTVRICLVNSLLAALYMGAVSGVYRSFRSVVVIGGRGCERRAWFELLEPEFDDTVTRQGSAAGASEPGHASNQGASDLDPAERLTSSGEDSNASRHRTVKFDPYHDYIDPDARPRIEVVREQNG